MKQECLKYASVLWSAFCFPGNGKHALPPNNSIKYKPLGVPKTSSTTDYLPFPPSSCGLVPWKVLRAYKSLFGQLRLHLPYHVIQQTKADWQAEAADSPTSTLCMFHGLSSRLDLLWCLELNIPITDIIHSCSEDRSVVWTTPKG